MLRQPRTGVGKLAGRCDGLHGGLDSVDFSLCQERRRAPGD
jgi:hypothetical protein